MANISIDIRPQQIQVGITKAPSISFEMNPQGPAGNDGTDGSDGREVELQTGATHIQWRYIGEIAWNDLIAIADLEGPPGTPGTPGTDGEDGQPGAPGTPGDDGREIEIQNNGTYIQWRYVGDLGWTNLILLADLKGDPGTPGTPGDDGREIEIQKGTTHIQWRYVGDVSWIDLVALADITGADGADGAPGISDDAIGCHLLSATEITAGLFGFRPIECASTIKGWTVLSDLNCTVDIRISKATYAAWPTMTEILHATISGARKNTSSGLNYSLAAGDVLEFKVDSQSGAKEIWLLLHIQK